MKRKTRSIFARGCWVSFARPPKSEGSYQSAHWYNATKASRARLARFLWANKSRAQWLGGIQWHEATL